MRTALRVRTETRAETTGTDRSVTMSESDDHPAAVEGHGTTGHGAVDRDGIEHDRMTWEAI